MRTDFIFIEKEDEKEKEALSKNIIREQELMNEIKKKQINDQKNANKKKPNKSRKKGSKFLL